MSKKFRHFIFSILTIILVSLLVNNSFAQNRFWVNGSGSWNDINHWAETSGGNSGASIPTKLDNVTFDNNSFTANNQTILINGTAICKDFTWNVENYKPAFKSKSFLIKAITKAELQVYGSLIIEENFENQFFGDIVLKTTGESILSSKVELNSNLTIDSKKGEYKLNSSLWTNGNLILNSGAFISNDNDIDCNSFISSGKEKRLLDLGKSTVSVDAWNLEETENLAYKSDKFILRYNNKFDVKDFKLGGLNYKAIIPKGASKAIFRIDSIPEIPVSCNGGTDGSITVYVSGGGPNYIYELYDGPNASYPLLSSVTQPGTSCQFIGLEAKTYYIIAKESTIGGLSGTQAFVTEPAVFSANSILVNQGLTCFDGSDAELEADPSGGNPPYTYEWYKMNFGTSTYEKIVDSTRKVLTGVSQGLFKVEVTDQKGCGALGYVLAEHPLIRGYDDGNVPDSIHISSVTSTNSCTTPANSGTITVSATGGNGIQGYYLMLGVTRIPVGLDADGIFTGLAPGTYEIYAVDNNNCEKQGNDVTITTLNDPTASILPPSPADACPGIPLTLDGNPSHGDGTSFVSHVWSGVDADSLDNKLIQSPDFTSVVVGVYNLTYTVTDNNGCIATDNIVVNVDDIIDPTITCIAPPTRNTDAGECYYTVVGTEFDPTSVNDNCGVASVVNDVNGTATLAGEQIADGTVVTWTVTDIASNTAQCNYTVTVNDTENPTITCIAPPTRNNDAGQCYYTVVGTEFDPIATSDNCGVASIVNDVNGTATLAGEQITDGTVVTWTVTDNSLNTAQCNYTVTVNDTENPTITCIAPPTRNNDAGQCYYTVVGAEFDPIATNDNCGFTVTNDVNGTATLAGEQITDGTVVTWTITDDASNTAQCNYTVTVNDIENPTITCIAPPTRNNDAGQCYYTVVGTEFDPIATGDNCGFTVTNDVNGTATLAGEQITDGTVVTWTVTDNSSNTAQCNYTVTVNDTENPSITCIAAPTRNPDVGQCYYTVVGTEFDPTATSDNCGIASVVNDVNGTATLAGEQIVNGTVITWTITDNSLNTAQCNYTVTVIDNEDPTITCIAPPTRNNDAGQCYYTVVGVEFDPIATGDNCGVASVVNDINGTATLAGEQITDGTVVTWTITDNASNTAQCNYTVTVNDIENPTITCIAPPTRNNDAGQCYYTVVGTEFDPTATGDNCGIASVVNDVNGTSTLAGEQIADGTVVTWTVTDNSSNTAQCNYTVTVNDTENPSITCIAAPTRNPDLGQCYYTVVGTEFDPIATSDNCGIASVVNDVNGTATLAGEQIVNGTVITWTITDNSLNTAQCNYTVTVTDNEDPTITCIAPPTRNNDAGQCYYTVVGVEFDPIATGDNCGVASVVNDINGTATLAGEQITDGTIVTWTITDNASNTAQCNYTVTVNDIENPTITCIAPPTRNNDAGQCYYTVVGTEFDPTATGDNCGIASVVNDVNGTSTLAGEQITDGTVVTWTVTDNSSNTAQCNYTVTVNDTENPSITCIAAPTRNPDLGQCYYTVVGTEFDPTVTTDNCGIASVVNDVNGTATLAGEQITNGTVITWTITDNSLNTAQCNYTVTVIDNEDPTITCIAPPTRNNDAGQCYYTVVGAEFDPIATGDNCGVASVVNDVNGTATLAGEQITDGTVVTWTITDNASNTAQCNYTVTVNDIENPTITCIAPPTRNNDAGQCYYTVVGTEFDPTVTADNCGIASIVNDVNGTATLAGEQIVDGTVVTWTVTDNASNTAQCNYTVTVNDTENPTITCIAPPTRNNDVGQCYYTVVGTEFDPTVTADNCGIASVVNDVNGTATLAGEQIVNGTVITWTITDNSLNTAQCNYTVTVTDNEDPTITCIAPPTRNNDAGQCYYTVVGVEFDPIATGDNCGIASVVNDVNGTATLAGEQILDGTVVTWTITDNSLNTAQCNYTVTVTDTENPTITCIAPPTRNNDAGQCYYTVVGVEFDPIATGDNCGIASIVNDVNGTATLAGEQITDGTVVTWTVTDNASNTAQCNYTVTVNDIENPTITCIAPPTRNNDAGQCYYTVVGTEFDPTVTADNCGIASVVNDVNGTATLAGEQITDGTLITWTITDNSLNTAQCNYTVTVNDNENPTITCPSDVLVIQDGSCTAIVNGLTPLTADNCGVIALQTWSMVGATVGNSPIAGINDISGTAFNIGLTTVTYHIEDAVGNFVECSFDVEIYDVVDGGLIDADQTICYNTSPNPFTDETSASVCGGLTYQWQMKSGNGTWGDIIGATNADYTEFNPLTEVTYYNRKAISDLTFGTAYSDTITINIEPKPIAVAGADTTLCFGTPYQILDADTTNSDGVSWEILTGNGSINLADINKIDPVYIPDALDGGTTVELVLHASGRATCADATDTIKITYYSELSVSIGKPTPFFIDSTSTHINVHVEFSGHKYIGNLGVFLVSPLDSIVELKPYCTAPLPPNIQAATFDFYNDPLDTSAIVAVNACNSISGRYDFSGEWKEKLQDQDPANGSWRIRIGNNRNWGLEGIIDSAAISFSDSSGAILETVLYADSTDVDINQWSGGDPTITDHALPITGVATSCYLSCDATAVATASGGLGPDYIYEWNDSLNFDSPDVITGDTVDLCKGKNYIRVTDMYGCWIEDSIFVGSPPEIVITNRTIVNNKCNGDSIGEVTLEFTGGTGGLTYTHDKTGISKNSGETFNILKADSYKFTISDVNCSIDTTIIITEPTAISITTNVTEISCYGFDDGQIEIIASGGTPGVINPYQYSIDSTDNWSFGNNFSPLEDKKYIIAVQDSLNCIVYGDTVFMNNPDTITIDSIWVTPVICDGSAEDGTITVFAESETGDLDYSINNGVDFYPDSLFTNLAGGSYQVVVQNANACSKTLDSLVVVNEPIVITYDSVVHNSCYGDTSGVIKLEFTGGSGDLQYTLDSITWYNSGDTLINLAAGKYAFAIHDNAANCKKDTTIFITEPTAISITTNVTEISCYGFDDGQIEIIASGGTPRVINPYQYSIDSTDNWSFGNTFSPLEDKKYIIAVQDSLNCIAYGDTIFMNNPDTITIDSIWVTPVICDGSAEDGTITVFAESETGDLDYSINNGVDFYPDSLFTNLAGGSYQIVVQNANACSKTLDSLVVVDGPIVITYDSIVHNSCYGDTSGVIKLEFTGGSGDLQYTLDSITWYNSGDTLINLAAGKYAFAIHDNVANCKKDTTIYITEPTPMTITVDSTNISCYGVPEGEIDITVSGGTPGYQYSIDSAVTWHGNPFINLAQDTFYVAVKDGAGCIQFADTIEMLYPDTISIDAITIVPTTCAGGGVDGQIIISASGGVSTLEYSLDGIAYQASNTFSGLSICDTTVYVRDKCGSKKLDSLVSVTGPTNPVINSIIVTDVSCNGDNTGQLTVNVSEGTGVYEYYIDGAINTNDPPNENIFTDLVAGTYTISVIDDGGCSSADSIREITQPNILTITGIDVTHVSECNALTNIGEITINAAGGTTAYQYSVTGYPLQLSNTFSNLDIGNYTITVEDFKGCKVTLDTSIVLTPAMNINLYSTDVSCNGGSDGSITMSINNGTPNYTYKWSNGDETSAISDLSAGVYTVTVIDGNSPDPCQDIKSIEVFEPTALTIAPDIRHKRCIYSSPRNDKPLSNSLGRIIVDVNGGTPFSSDPFYSYSWTGPTGILPDNDTIINLQPGSYNLTVTDSKGCERLLSATIDNDESSDILSFAVDFEDNSVCWNDSVRFTANYSGTVDSILIQAQTLSGYSEDWNFKVNANPYYGMHSIKEKVILWIIKATNDICQESAPRDTIDYFPDFELDIVPGFDDNSLSDTIYLKGSNKGQLGATFADYIDVTDLSFAWTPEESLSPANEQFTTISPKESGFYNLHVTSTDNCVDSSTVYLEFIPAITPYSGFSPNGDGVNDYWEINFIDKFPNNIVTVYNRWGVKVFEQKGYDNNDTSKSWDGNAKNGKELSSGTYYYVIILNEEGFSTISGSITIIR